MSSSNNLIRTSILMKKDDTAALKNANDNEVKEMKAFLELDTKRYNIKKKDVEKLKSVSLKHAQKYAEFQQVDSALKGGNQYPHTGFHALVTKKYDHSLD
jgi:hypothetical protein